MLAGFEGFCFNEKKCSKKYLKIHIVVNCGTCEMRGDECTGTLANKGALYILNMFVVAGVGNGVAIGLR